jgi:hypothetical protein
MKKIMIIIAGLCVFLSACEDVYVANTDNVENLLVVEAVLTNDASVSYVKLTKTLNFYESGGNHRVAGAAVTITDKSGNSYSLSESSTGYFVPAFSAVPGESYRIKVEAEGETYESDYELMPSLPAEDSIYVQPDTISTYTYDEFGAPMSHQKTGMNVYADLPLNSGLEHYRFSLPHTLEYVIPPPSDGAGPPPPPTWGWQKFKPSGGFTIHGPASYGNESSMKKRKLLFLPNDIGEISQHLKDTGAYMTGWIVDMSMFGISEKTYNFYESVNAQLEAEGKLFDPVYAQLVPNFECVSNPEKKAVGYFEVSSYTYKRFFVMAPIGRHETYFHYVDDPLPITDFGEQTNSNPPAFWENP